MCRKLVGTELDGTPLFRAFVDRCEANPSANRRSAVPAVRCTYGCVLARSIAKAQYRTRVVRVLYIFLYYEVSGYYHRCCSALSSIRCQSPRLGRSPSEEHQSRSPHCLFVSTIGGSLTRSSSPSFPDRSPPAAATAAAAMLASPRVCHMMSTRVRGSASLSHFASFN